MQQQQRHWWRQQRQRRRKNDAYDPAEKEQKAGGGGDSGVDSDMEEVAPLNGRCFKKLVQIGPGKYVQDRIIKMMARNTSWYAFAAMLSNPKKLMEGIFEQLEPYGNLV